MTGLTEYPADDRRRQPPPSQLRIYRTEARHEFLKLIRMPIFAISTIAFPLMFYVIFGLAFADETAGGVGVTTYMLATYGAFGVIGWALFGFGVAVADRARPGLDAPQARLADAAAGLLRGQDRDEHAVRDGHRGGCSSSVRHSVASGCRPASGSASPRC